MKKKESDLRHKRASSEEDSLFEELEQFSYAEWQEDESEVKMDFSFEDLMEKVEEKNQDSNPAPAKIIAFNPNVILKYIGGIAACGLMVLGTIHALNHHHDEDQHAKVVEVVQHKLKADQIQNKTIQIDESNAGVNEKQTVNSAQLAHLPNPIQKEKKVEETNTVVPSAKLKQEELVVLNGEEVEDDKMAEEIAINALKILAKNLNQGNQAVNQLKHLSIEL